jgi:hypothetical protein
MEIDALKNPWSKMNFHFLGRPGLTAFLSSWSRAFSAPELAAFHFNPSVQYGLRCWRSWE